MKPIQTERLSLETITLADASFMLELVNTPTWIAFIGQRNVHSIEDAENYIAKLIQNPQINYWVVKLKSTQTALGVITLLKKEYLPSHDIGFAFLPQFSQNGYAYEAAKETLSYATLQMGISPILATTLPHNHRSIQLVEKLGLHFEKEIVVENEKLLLYSI